MSDRPEGPGETPADDRAEFAVLPAMPAWASRAIITFIGAAAGLWISLWLVVQLRTLLILLLVSLFGSFAMEPAVNWLAARGMRRGLATGLVMVGGVVATGLFLVLMGQVLFTQISDFIGALTEPGGYIERVERWANTQFDLELDSQELIAELSAEDGRVQELATNLAANAFALTTKAVGLVFQFFTIALFTFYMVADGPRFRRTVLQFLPQERQERVLAGWEIAIDKTGGYIYSRALLALLSGLSTMALLWVLGVPFAVALGLWVGIVSQFVPTVGTYIGGALPVLVALGEDPVDAGVVLGFILVYQQIENYVFSPKITARTMDLHPAVAFGTVIAGASLLGGIGAVLALPAAAVIQAIGSTYVERHDVIDSAMTRDQRRHERSSLRKRVSTRLGRGAAQEVDEPPAD